MPTGQRQRSLSGWFIRSLLATAMLVFVMHPARLRAQTQPAPAAIKGTVLNPNGTGVANAAVVVRGASPDQIHPTTTDADGRFQVAGLPAGDYTVEVTASGFASARQTNVRLAAGGSGNADFTLSLGPVTEAVTVNGALETLPVNAPSLNSLTATSAQSVISGEFIRDFTSPVADFAEVVEMAPGTFSLNANGVGLGQGKTFYRGFSDGQYTMTFDGIPFQDTNSPTHHSWAFFPSQMIGGTVFDRSPGTAATMGPANFGGTINLLSNSVPAKEQVDGTVSYGSFNTRLLDATYASGRFGGNDSSSLVMDVHDMQSDGYQTFNDQHRDAFSMKYQYAISDQTTLTAFGSFVDLRSNTPNFNGPTRAQVAQFGNNFLMSGDPTQPTYFGYNFYAVPTDFSYVGLKSNLGHGWSIDDKTYLYGYHNHQNYNSTTAISATSAVDKLNAYRTTGNLLPLSQVSQWGTLRTGLWSEYSWTNRYQIPSNPQTGVDAPLPNFHEMFNTLILEPYAEYEFQVGQDLTVTPGVKFNYYNQNLTQLPDNGKIVGNLNGAASVSNQAAYHSWLPTFTVHYMLQPTWSAYAQYAQGDTIPPTSVFDVKNGAVLTIPKPTLATTYQVGSVWKANRISLDVDTYYINFQNGYSTSIDPTSGEPVYFLSGNSVTKGVEGEANLNLGAGLSVYLNATGGTAKYVTTGLWVANAPQDTETLGLSYDRAAWDVGLYNKRIGQMYNDNGGTNQAVVIAPFTLVNAYVNYTVRNGSRFDQTKIKLAVDNLTNNQNIVGLTPASTKTSIPAPGDVLTLLPGRSISLTVTFGLSQRKP
jgi:iron complex outermembrane receptor protein